MDLNTQLFCERAKLRVDHACYYDRLESYNIYYTYGVEIDPMEFTNWLASFKELEGDFDRCVFAKGRNEEHCLEYAFYGPEEYLTNEVLIYGLQQLVLREHLEKIFLFVEFKKFDDFDRYMKISKNEAFPQEIYIDEKTLKVYMLKSYFDNIGYIEYGNVSRDHSLFIRNCKNITETAKAYYRKEDDYEKKVDINSSSD